MESDTVQPTIKLNEEEEEDLLGGEWCVMQFLFGLNDCQCTLITKLLLNHFRQSQTKCSRFKKNRGEDSL